MKCGNACEAPRFSKRPPRHFGVVRKPEISVDHPPTLERPQSVQNRTPMLLGFCEAPVPDPYGELERAGKDGTPLTGTACFAVAGSS